MFGKFSSLCILINLSISSAFGQQLFPIIEQEQLQLQEQREAALQQQMQSAREVRFDIPPPQSTPSLPQDETPCFPIEQVLLDGEEADIFAFALRQTLAKTRFSPSMRLGSQGINSLISGVQNALIARGYTTTRVFADSQDLRSKVLTLTVVPGRIGAIRVDTEHKERTHAGRVAAFQNEIPAAAGDILNLRDLEQGLENYKRLPTVEADIQIIPGQQANQSDVVVQWQQREFPLRVSLGVDDAGSKATGKYQGTATLAFDNPLGLSDLFYASYTRELGHKDRFTDADGHTTSSGSNSYSFHYSAPFGDWTWSWHHSRYRYHQAVAGLSQNYDYNGISRTFEVGTQRLLYRDGRRKTHLGGRLWQRSTHSFINDAEIGVQRRKTAGWALDLTHKEYLGPATLNLALSYKRGTGRADSLPAPEEAFGEGTSRMRILTADVGLNLPFSLGGQTFVYEGKIHSQWNQTPLTALDRLSIGNRYTVRGFDGEITLSGDRGWYWRNDLAWQYLPAHQLYLGVDTGHVSGQSARYLVGNSLTGGALGFRGQFQAGGALYYDAFIGAPLHKPAQFHGKSPVFGFYFNYSF